jgi:hypothetical protein
MHQSSCVMKKPRAPTTARPYALSVEYKAALVFLLLARFSATPLHFPSSPSRPAPIPPRSAPVPPLLYAMHRPSSRQLPQRWVLFSAPPVTIRERPAVDPSRPQASAPTGPKPMPSAFRREHLNAASCFRQTSGPNVAATSFASPVRTSSAHHPCRRPPDDIPHRRPYSTDAHRRGVARPMSLLSPFPLKSVRYPLLHALDAAAPPSCAAPRRESGRPPSPLPWRHGRVLPVYARGLPTQAK